MTDRKPPGVRFETWVERQIREAEDRGAFRDLPGAGRPLGVDTEPYDENWWVKAKLRREQLELLPPSLVLRREVERAIDGLHRVPTEEKVRALVADLNGRILDELLTPHPGPPLGLRLLKPDEVVARWRAARSDAGQRDEPPLQEGPQQGGRSRLSRRRSWWRRQ